MASLTEDSDLISKLESSTSTHIYSDFSNYLIPFDDFKNSDKSQTLTRSLAKQFLPFLNRSLSIIPKRLSDLSKSKDIPKEIVSGLLDTYRLCLDCLELVASQLSCKSYTVSIQRLRLVYCLEQLRLYKEAENEGFRVLQKIKGLDVIKKKKKEKDKFLPVLAVKENVDSELAKLVIEVVVCIVKCVALEQSKDCEDYRRVIGLVDEVRPWFRELDANTHEKLHRVLVTYLGKCTLFLVGELSNFDGGIVHSFCVTAVDEYIKSSLKDQIYKFARRICSSLFLHQYDIPQFVIDILKSILDSLASRCKVEDQNLEIEFVQLVSYCADKCRTASTNFCSTVEAHLNNIADVFCQAREPMDKILRLYAIGLTITDSVVNSRVDDATSSKSSKDEPAFNSLLTHGARLSDFAPLLGSLQSFFYVGCEENCVSCGVEYKDSDSLLYSESDSHYGISLACKQKNRKVYLLSYLSALKFLCQPLAALVNSEKKQIVTENGVASISTILFSIQEAFDKFFDIFLLFQSTASEGEGDEFDENIILSVAVAAFTISIRTKLKLQKSVHVMKHILDSKWIQPQGLKYLFSSLYNLGIHLYRNKQVNEASKALKLSCRASWTCAVLFCQMYMNKSNGDLSEDVISDFITEACTRTAFLLDIVYQCGSLKLKKIIVNGLENWSVAEDLFRSLPGPMPLVKQWVKIECKRIKNLDVDDEASTLYHLLSSSKKLSKRTIGKILQQELNAYEEMDIMYPELCQRMQLEIIDILLQDVYVMQDSCLERSRLLLRKGRALRAFGFNGLRDCIQCLTDAISVINAGKHGGGIPTSLQLAMAHCLRGLCIQEAEPNSKQVLQDVQAAISIWLSIPISDDGNLLSGSGLILLYNIVDLLAAKGSMEFHYNVYKLMIRILELKNVPLEKFLSILWESRRLSHALCISPVYDELLMNLSRDYGEQFKSTGFWIHCLKASPPLLVGFQQNFSYLFTSVPCSSGDHETPFQSDITVDDVKQAALELVSRAPVTSCSIFFAGCLYYDLCEKLIASGHIFEALSYAKEAHRLRTKLFQEKFTYSVEQQTEKHIEVGDHSQKLTYAIRNLRVNKSIACKLWYSDGKSSDEEVYYLSPWKILQCYLESTLQVGTVHEIVGNGGEAETFLLWGKDISCQQSLPLFVVAFSSVLGKVYRKKRSWDLSQKELQSAKQNLESRSSAFSCLKCRLILEVTVDQQLADLSRNCIFDAARNVSLERLSHAESLYKSSLDKLNLSEWKNSTSFPEKVDDGTTNKCACSDTSRPDMMDFVSTRSGPNAKMKGRKNRQTKPSAKSSLKEQSSMTECNTRLTRSRYRSSQNQNVNSSEEEQHGLFKHPNDYSACDLNDANSQRKLLLETRSSTVDFGCEVVCICNKLKCWFCLAMEVKESGLLMNFINMKWELVRRRLSLRILSSRGKCLQIHGEIHEAHEIILQSASVLVSRNPFTQSYSAVSHTFLLDLVGTEYSGDVFAVERAALLFDICWFSLKSYHSKDNRTICCDLSHVKLQKVASWLMLAFVLCREVPKLFQKVSRLLSGIFTLSSSSEHFSLPSYCKVLSEGHWASYFHQASLGTHHTCQFFSSITQKHKAEHLEDDQGSQVTGATCKGAETCNLPSLAPKSLQDMEHFVTDFFSSLPSTMVVCISLIGDPYATLLQELLMYPSRVCAWMLLSRLNSKSHPIMMLLPVDLISEETSDDDAPNPGSEEFPESNDLDKHWHCPWGFTVIDEVSPAFKLILEENYLSSSIFPLEDTKENRTLWWMRRKKLDFQLGKLLRKMEDLWLGPWRCVLLGELSDSKHLDSVQKKLMRNLKSKCKVDVNESFLKVILGGGKSVLDAEACIYDILFLKKGCFIGKVIYSDEETCKILTKEFGVQKLPNLAIQLIHEAVNELEVDIVTREPLILVLDFEVQMLPWENLPVLRNQEVYRMPSVASICSTLDRSCNNQEQVGRIFSAFPFIDPLDAFYLLNPSGDLSSTQVEFENWFRDQNLEGKAGCAPTAEELTSALKNHDLFLYFGHGSGAQYISQQEIQKLENCAATLLMGCSSGALSLNGSYIPHGTPLSYLLAGSPVIVANLWEVTDKDIDRFGKVMLDAWLKERSIASSDCIQCNLLAEEFEAMNLKDRKVATKKRVQKKKEPETCDGDALKNSCNHRPKIGSFMSQAREACRLPYLIGASPVCYGVPTGIRRKKDL
ncbi:separase [Ricinus communis]|uniref:separase n=1 Tax=Ricinus communis TaxID=3988 RepID=UPI0007727CD3|nr:separase [Ricinus communis]|eukprot:XP_015580756.1 separase isoform X2 [Ricinus communis]